MKLTKFFFVLTFCMVGAVDSAWAESTAPPPLENAPVVPATPSSPKQDGATATPDYSTMPQDTATQRRLEALQSRINEVESNNINWWLTAVMIFSTFILIILAIITAWAIRYFQNSTSQIQADKTKIEEYKTQIEEDKIQIEKYKIQIEEYKIQITEDKKKI